MKLAQTICALRVVVELIVDGIGVNPVGVEKGELERVYGQADQVMSLAVRKNGGYSPDCTKVPEMYESVIRAWREG
jgi:hypothetical protein